jgi:hypothetical protein
MLQRARGSLGSAPAAMPSATVNALEQRAASFAEDDRDDSAVSTGLPGMVPARKTLPLG